MISNKIRSVKQYNDKTCFVSRSEMITKASTTVSEGCIESLSEEDKLMYQNIGPHNDWGIPKLLSQLK